jgi:hypothetical protein
VINNHHCHQTSQLGYCFARSPGLILGNLVAAHKHMAHLKLNKTDEYPFELSLSKLHRVLRPLRSSALALAELLNSPSALLALSGRRPGDRKGFANSTPFSSSNSLLIPSGSPRRPQRVRSLTAASTSLDDHGSLISVTSPDRIHASRLALATHRGVPHDSPKIIAVREAFRAVVKVVYPNKPQSSNTIPALSQMCAAVLGASIEPTVVALATVDDDDSSADERDEEGPEETEIVDKYYEDIPEHLRRFVALDLLEMVDVLMRTPGGLSFHMPLE